jgi:hypothetical protein
VDLPGLTAETDVIQRLHPWESFTYAFKRQIRQRGSHSVFLLQLKMPPDSMLWAAR